MSDLETGFYSCRVVVVYVANSSPSEKKRLDLPVSLLHCTCIS